MGGDVVLNLAAHAQAAHDEYRQNLLTGSAAKGPVSAGEPAVAGAGDGSSIGRAAGGGAGWSRARRGRPRRGHGRRRRATSVGGRPALSAADPSVGGRPVVGGRPADNGRPVVSGRPVVGS